MLHMVIFSCCNWLDTQSYFRIAANLTPSDILTLQHCNIAADETDEICSQISLSTNSLRRITTLCMYVWKKCVILCIELAMCGGQTIKRSKCWQFTFTAKVMSSLCQFKFPSVPPTGVFYLNEKKRFEVYAYLIMYFQIFQYLEGYSLVYLNIRSWMED